MTTHKTTEGWEDRFYDMIGYIFPTAAEEVDELEVKRFIQSEIAQAKKEEREKIVEFLDTRTAKNILASIYLDKSYIDIDNSIIKEIKDFLSEPAPNE
jgi:hypothetical protein